MYLVKIALTELLFTFLQLKFMGYFFHSPQVRGPSGEKIEKVSITELQTVILSSYFLRYRLSPLETTQCIRKAFGETHPKQVLSDRVAAGILINCGNF